MKTITEEEFWNLTLQKRRKYVGIIEFNDRFVFVKNQKTHREDGPAVIYKEKNLLFYYLNSIQITKEEHDFYVDLLRLKNINET